MRPVAGWGILRVVALEEVGQAWRGMQVAEASTGSHQAQDDQGKLVSVPVCAAAGSLHSGHRRRQE